MLTIGCHLSFSDGYLHMGKEALSIGANTFQFFTRNPRGGSAKKMDEADAAALREFCTENHFGTLLAHAPYTMNPCSADEGLRNFALDMMTDDLKRMSFLPGSLYNFHPGSHVGQGIEAGISLISGMLNTVLAEDYPVTVLLETMAGKGSEVGSRFEELREIIDRVDAGDRLGVCLDTCHVNDAGYDIVNDLDGVLTEYDRVLGLPRLKAIHLNDSKNPFSSHKDRHEKIGQGSLGIDAITRIINHPVLRDKPFFLETPNELPGYAQEIALLKSLYRE